MEAFSLNLPPMRKTNKPDKRLEVIFEDDSLIIVSKPAGMLSVSTGKGGETTAHAILSEHFGRVFIVHRLDRDTSGLLVFAKDEDTKHALQENWNEAVRERKYIAVLEGHIESEEGWVESWLYENPKSMKVHCYALRPADSPEKPPRKDWQYASTHCRTLGHIEIEGMPYTKVEFELETGRKNQIRVHSEWIGHPIAGDRKYGARTNPLGRLALHAHTLSFIHPWTGKVMKFTKDCVLLRGCGRPVKF